jgi:hypothetical protein
MKPVEVVDRYFAGVKARDIDAWLALFADDALYSLPDGREFSGIDAIREIQQRVFASGAPIPSPRVSVVGEHSVAVEVEAVLPDGTVRHTANIFQLDETGKIVRLSVYRKG